MVSTKGRALVGFLDWYLDAGQVFCEQLHYVPLPAVVVRAVKNKVRSIKVDDNDKKT